MKQLLSRVSIFCGIIFILCGLGLAWQRYNPYTLSFSNVETRKISKASSLKPIEIIIPREHIDLPIFPAIIKDNTWPTSDKGASYLASYPIPGEQGNSIIYGHNWTTLFGKLVDVHQGDIIRIIMSDRSTRKFTVTYTKIVTPDAVDILNSTNDTRLTIYTCTGFMDAQRFVVIAN